MARTSKTMLNESGENGHLCLIPDLRGRRCFPLLRMMFPVDLSYSLYYTEVCFLYAHFPEIFFYHKWMLNFVKSIFCINWDNHMVFILQFVNAVYHIDWFTYVEEFLHFWDKPHLIRVYDEEQLLREAAGHRVGLPSMHHRSQGLRSCACGRDQVLGTSVQN